MQGFWVQKKGREKASGFGKGVEKVIGDKDESQKSGQGNPGPAGALAEQLEPGSGVALQGEGSHPVSNPQPRLLNSSLSFSPEPCTSPVWGPGVSAQVQEPLR